MESSWLLPVSWSRSLVLWLIVCVFLFVANVLYAFPLVLFIWSCSALFRFFPLLLSAQSSPSSTIKAINRKPSYNPIHHNVKAPPATTNSIQLFFFFKHFRLGNHTKEYWKNAFTLISNLITLDRVTKTIAVINQESGFNCVKFFWYTTQKIVICDVTLLSITKIVKISLFDGGFFNLHWRVKYQHVCFGKMSVSKMF